MPSSETWVRALLIVLMAAALLVSWRLFQDSYTLVGAIGGVVGATELMARYRDAPFVPMSSVPGIFYVLLNAGASTLAFYILNVLAVNFGTDPERANLYRVATASIGAMAVFRSGLFTLRVGESDVAVGPNLVLQVVLGALDRSYDRMRARPRSARVAEIMAEVEFDRASEALPTFCLNIMQNVGVTEREELGTDVNKFKDSLNMTNEAKTLNLGLALMNLVGERTLAAAVQSLGHNIKGVPPLDMSIVGHLAACDPDTIVAHLPEACRSLSHPRSRAQDLEPEVGEVRNLPLPASNRATLLIHVLIRKFGTSTVSVALKSLVP